MLRPHFNFSDTDGFVDLLNSPHAWDAFRLDWAAEGVFFSACEKYLLPRINRAPIIRCFTVRYFYSHLQQCFADRIKVKLHPFRRGYGYLLDRGEVHILADLLFKAPHVRFISVVLHETAHVALSQWDSYDKLQQLDVLFAERYLKDQHNGLLKTVTPVEFFAQLLANQWMRAAAELTSDLELKESVKKETDRMRSKLLSATERLSEIQIQNNSLHTRRE